MIRGKKVPKLILFIQASAAILSVASSNCINDSFSFCGIDYLKFPFWGGSRGPECGRPGFHVTCDAAAGVALLNISSLPYRIQPPDFSTNTLKVVRQDLQFQNGDAASCPHRRLRNTTLDPQLFRFPPNSTDRNLTLYFDCKGDGLDNLRNIFKCNSTTNLFTMESGPAAGVSCRSSIFVPVNKDDAQSLEDPSDSSVNILRSALASGFSIQWLNQSDCAASDFCGQQKHGLPPAQSPGSPTESLGDDSLKPRHGSRKGKIPAKTTAIVMASIVIGVIMLYTTIRCALKRRPPNTPNPESKQEVENFLLQHGSLTPKRFKYSEIKKITKSLSDKLGEGGYGSVYTDTLPDGCPVAVKILIQTDSNGEDFINEVASISRTSHINIVTLLGFCYEGNRIALVYEFMPNNSLDKFLNHNQSLGLENLFKIAIGMLASTLNSNVFHLSNHPRRKQKLS